MSEVAPLPVTQRQLELLRVLHRWGKDHGRMPSVRELARLLSRSPSTIHQHLAALERRGLIERDGQANGVKLLVEGTALLPPEPTGGATVPLKGTLAPGRALRRRRPPYPQVPVAVEAKRGDYALQVEGDRLQADGILAGDLLVVRPGTARGMPALIQALDGTMDVKRVTTLRDGTLGLLSARPGPVNRRGARRAGNIVVQGRVLQVVRSFDSGE
jgi:repressor LexA